MEKSPLRIYAYQVPRQGSKSATSSHDGVNTSDDSDTSSFVNVPDNSTEQDSIPPSKKHALKESLTDSGRPSTSGVSLPQGSGGSGVDDLSELEQATESVKDKMAGHPMLSACNKLVQQAKKLKDDAFEGDKHARSLKHKISISTDSKKPAPKEAEDFSQAFVIGFFATYIGFAFWALYCFIGFLFTGTHSRYWQRNITFLYPALNVTVISRATGKAGGLPPMPDVGRVSECVRAAILEPPGPSINKGASFLSALGPWSVLAVLGWFLLGLLIAFALAVLVPILSIIIRDVPEMWADAFGQRKGGSKASK